MLGLTSKIADDSLNFIYSDKINPESPLYKEYIDLLEIRSNYEKRLNRMERSWKAGDGTYISEQQYNDIINPLKEKLNSTINRIQQITGDAGSNQAMKVIGYSSANDPKAEDFKPKPKADLGDANIVLADSRWGQLSNLADHTFTYDGREYRSVEHAYQANKSGKFHEPTYRAYFDRPEARKINTGPPANKKTNIKLMEDLYRQMLSENPDMVDLLKETEGFNITHQLKKNDIWTTEMPKILIKLRDEFATGTPELKTVGWIDELADNEIFVFGSNKKGIHGANAALQAKNQFGAEIGVGEGLTGQTYALPTKSTPYKSLTVDEVSKNIDTFLEVAKNNPDKIFKMTPIGTNLAGFEAQEIADLLFSKDIPSNVHVPESLFKLKGGTGITPSPTKMIEVEGDFGGPGDAYRARTGRTGGTVGDITIDFVTQATYDRGAGSGATKGSTQSGKKPYQPIVVKDDGTMKGGQIDELAQIIADNLTTGKTVNIAGHGAYVSPGSRTGFKQPMDQEVFNNELNKVFDKVLEIIGDQPITGKVITGGQSGYDLAGSRAAASHGIPNEAYYSSTKAEGGALFRNPDGQDVDNLEEFRKRFNRFGPGGMPPIDTPEFGEWYEKEIEAKNSKEIINDIAKNVDVEPSRLRKVMGEVPGFLVVPLEAAIEVGLRYGRMAKAHPNLAKNARRFIMYELAMFAGAVVTGLSSYYSAKYDATNEFGYSSKDLYSSYSYDRTSEDNVRRMEESVAYNKEITELYELYPELKEYNEAMAHQFAMQEASENMDFFIKKMPTYYIDEILFEYVPVLKEAREEYIDKKFFSEGGWRAALAQPQLVEKGIEWTIDAILGNKRVEKEAWSYDNR